MKTQFNTIIAAIMVANGNKEWILPTPITVRVNDFTAPIEIHGLQVSTNRELAVMTIDEIGGRPESFWHKLDLTDAGADKMICSIYDRVMKSFKPQTAA